MWGDTAADLGLEGGDGGSNGGVGAGGAVQGVKVRGVIGEEVHGRVQGLGAHLSGRGRGGDARRFCVSTATTLVEVWCGPENVHTTQESRIGIELGNFEL